MWAPWRMEYVRAPKKDSGNIFSKKLESGKDEDNMILYRGKHSFVCMNFYPYNNGHIMILPNNIVEKPEELDDVTQFEIMKIASLSMKIIREKMNAEGFNFGANIGESAGAGIAEHLHYHIIPRWNGDTNFMPVVGNTKVHAQGLADTYSVLKLSFNNLELS